MPLFLILHGWILSGQASYTHIRTSVPVISITSVLWVWDEGRRSRRWPHCWCHQGPLSLDHLTSGSLPRFSRIDHSVRIQKANVGTSGMERLFSGGFSLLHLVSKLTHTFSCFPSLHGSFISPLPFQCGCPNSVEGRVSYRCPYYHNAKTGPAYLPVNF